jgi:hypothetical protein
VHHARTALREGTTDVVAITSRGAQVVQQRRTLSVVLHPATAIDVGTARLDLQVHQRAGLSHTMTTVGQDLQLTFRLGGTNTIWTLSARLPQ